jgi:hypothetical protein
MERNKGDGGIPMEVFGVEVPVGGLEIPERNWLKAQKRWDPQSLLPSSER